MHLKEYVQKACPLEVDQIEHAKQNELVVAVIRNKPVWARITNPIP